MISSLGLVVVAVSYVSAQTAICTNSTYDWTFNSKGQSPCAITEYLGGVCNGGQFLVSPLEIRHIYLGPTIAEVNPCRCSTVFYSMISACSLCQTRDYLKWSNYNGNCTDVVSGFLGLIPSGTSVPHYAYLDVAVNDNFDPTEAHAALNLPESTRPAQTTATSTTPPLSTNSATNATSSSKAGPIAGGVVGGVVGLVLVALAVIWFVRRRRTMGNAGRPLAHTSPTPMSFNSMSASHVTPFPAASPKLYNPSDPSTYPSTATTSAVFTSQEHQPFSTQGHQHFAQSSNPGGKYQPVSTYTGAAEL